MEDALHVAGSALREVHPVAAEYDALILHTLLQEKIHALQLADGGEEGG